MENVWSKGILTYWHENTNTYMYNIEMLIIKIVSRDIAMIKNIITTIIDDDDESND